MATSTVLHAGPGLVLGEFHCPAHDPRWRGVEDIGDRPHVVFPRTAVEIAQRDRPPVLATANHAIFYDAHQPYRRSLRDARGDHCTYLAVSEPLLAEALDGREPRFPFVQGPLRPDDCLVQHVVWRALRRGEADPLVVDETLLRLLGRVTSAALALHEPRGRVLRRGTADEHRRVVEGAKALLAERLRDRLDLAAVARAVHASPFHLARVFRAGTGFSLHGYRTQLRLRLVLDRLGEPGLDLAALALDAGFASHSHLTDRFRAAFGLAPSAVGRARAREARRMLEARLPAGA
jgi:AraC-like DNA-binding protein